MRLYSISVLFLLFANHCSDAFLAHHHRGGLTLPLPLQLILISRNNERARFFPSSSTCTRLYYTHGDSFPSLPDSTDPFVILNLHPHLQHGGSSTRPRTVTTNTNTNMSTNTNTNTNTNYSTSTATTVDMKEIKRAYRRMALIYHPDARTTSNATKEERQIANDDFARINEAYAFLMSRISKDKPLRIPMPADTNANMPQTTQPTARSTATSTARTPKHTQSERKKETMAATTAQE